MLERKTKFYKFRNKFILSCFLTLSFFAITGLNVYASEITAEAMIKLTNQSRLESGLESLSVNSKLSRAAYLKASDMLKFDYFDHTSPSGIDPWHWIKSAGYNYHYAGENLAIDFITAEGTHRALMESSSHKENILNPHFKEIGVAVLEGEFKGSNSTVVVEMFASPFNSDFNFNKSEISEDAEIENKIEVKPEPKTESRIKNQESKPEIEVKIESPDINFIPKEPEAEIVNVPKDKKLIAELAPQKELNLLTIISAKENPDLIVDYLTGDLYFKDNNEIFKKYKKGAVLASADVQLKHSGNDLVYLFSLILIILTFKHTNI